MSNRLVTKSSQTEMMREDFSDLSALLPGGMNLGCSGEPGKCECESKNIKIIKEVIEKLELKFEQEKRDALEKLESKVHSFNIVVKMLINKMITNNKGLRLTESYHKVMITMNLQRLGNS